MDSTPFGARGRRVAIVSGARTPFCRRGTALRGLPALALGAAAVRAVVDRAGVPARDLERIVFGQVVPALAAHNVAREIGLDAGLPRDVDATSVARACTTGYQATIDLARAIGAGDVTGGVAGGTDSASDVPLVLSRPLADAVVTASRARNPLAWVRAFAGVSPRDLRPEPPSLVERATGLSMGEHAEQMARANHISRAAQDALAHRSHVTAAAAWADGRLAEDVAAVDAPGADGAPVRVARDNLVRAGSSPDAYARLRPIFDPDHGTVTSGNSSALTDGASALVLVREDVAVALGLTPLAFVRSAAFTALDPAGQLLMGPAYAIPRALDRAGVTLADLTLIDLHEAFAAQVLSVIQALGSASWAREHLGRDRAVGEVDEARLNVTGGSLALGHPFAATGGRQLMQTARELRRRGGGLACVAACGAGGLGAAIVLESP
ncbi:MAG: acetyl-CoA C-acyltransferase [Kofleriaceae bacterium]|nr:acetyl-CoA C-acyltransferase [Kofleriaceae bacterium]MCB9571580.1 acetyl-CoA C-acyltransferase [Kofleriaceae bacterium]